MDTDAKGQLGGIECSKDARERMARDSGKWACAACGKSNDEIVKERQEAVREIEAKEGTRAEEEVPEELRLAYRDELGKKDDIAPETTDKGKGKAVESEVQHVVPTEVPGQSVVAEAAAPASVVASSLGNPPALRPTRTVPAPPLQQMVQQSPDRSLAWIDTCIWGVVAMLLFMVIKKFDIL